MLSAERFRRASDDPAYGAEGQAELATQLARALGLAGRIDDGDAVLDAVVSESPIVAARVALERGRLRVSEGVSEEAIALFTLAAREAAAGGVTYLTLDALHMLALTDAGHEEEWAADGLELLATATQARTQSWGVALNNNLAWFLHDHGRADEALPYFMRALEAAKNFGTAQQRFQAHWGIGRCLRTLGRNSEALELQQALAVQRPDDRFVHEELAVLLALAEHEGSTQQAGATGAPETTVSGSAPTIEE